MGKEEKAVLWVLVIMALIVGMAGNAGRYEMIHKADEFDVKMQQVNATVIQYQENVQAAYDAKHELLIDLKEEMVEMRKYQDYMAARINEAFGAIAKQISLVTAVSASSE